MDTSKIIKGVVNSGRYTVTAPIVKEDYGLYLQIGGVELPQTYEVDFSNSEHNGTSVTMIGNADGVLIPHQFIDTGKDIFAFLYHVGANYGRTVYKFRIPNKIRPDRTEEQPTPEEQSAIDQAISALNEAVAQTAQDVIDADASAQNASADADRAESARDTAQGYANNAQTSANNASASAQASANSATASAQSASASAQIKSDVEDLVDDAQGYAQASERSASASANSASQASGYAQSASASAQSASGYASQAQTSAQTASSKATEASGYASTASAKATESAQSATNASQSAQTAEQAKTSAQTAQGLAESARDSAISAKDDAESARDEAQNIVDGISAKAEQIDANTASVASLEEDRYKPYATDTASGSIASFTDGADDIPLKSLVVDINPVQEGTGDPSPDNIRPITGWTGANIYDDPIYGGEITFNQLASLDVDDWGYASKMKMESNGRIMTFTLTGSSSIKFINIPLVPYHKYLFDAYINNMMSASVFYGIWKQATENNYLTRTTTVTGDSERKQTIWDADTGTPFFRFQASTVPEYGEFFTVENMQLFDLTLMFGEGNEPATVEEFYELFTDEYHEYNTGEKTCVSAVNNETYRFIPINWQTEAGTVYGGRLDVLTGKLTVYPYYASYNGETLTGEWISDRDVYAVGTTPTIGAQVVNIGAEGTEYQLEPHEVASLLGQNNIFADTGGCAVEYRADTKLYIERLTAPDSADMIADANITSGQYFMVGNSLYKATANIANGASIIEGTNCTRVSLAQALNEINS